MLINATPKTLDGFRIEAAINSVTTSRSNMLRKIGSRPFRSLRIIPATITSTATINRIPAICTRPERFAGIASKQQRIPVAALVKTQGRLNGTGAYAIMMGSSKSIAHNVPRHIMLATRPRRYCSQMTKFALSATSAGALNRYHHSRRMFILLSVVLLILSEGTSSGGLTGGTLIILPLFYL